ncbi:MAG: hypothetical protein ACI8W7_004195 [Gammaproteobacteria bacterium]|jgi:hypothetical protein
MKGLQKHAMFPVCGCGGCGRDEKNKQYENYIVSSFARTTAELNRIVIANPFATALDLSSMNGVA